MVRWRKVDEDTYGNEIVYEALGCNKNNEYIKVRVLKIGDGSRIKTQTEIIKKQTRENRFTRPISGLYNLPAHIQVKYQGVVRTVGVENYKYAYLTYNDKNIRFVLKAIGERFESGVHSVEVLYNYDIDSFINTTLNPQLQSLQLKSYNNVFGVMICLKGSTQTYTNVVKAKSMKDAVLNVLHKNNLPVYNEDDFKIENTYLNNVFFDCARMFEFQHYLTDREGYDIYRYLIFKFDTNNNRFVVHGLYY